MDGINSKIVSRVLCFNCKEEDFSKIPKTRGITDVFTTVYSIYLKVEGIFVSAKNYNLGTPHSRLLRSSGKKLV